MEASNNHEIVSTVSLKLNEGEASNLHEILADVDEGGLSDERRSILRETVVALDGFRISIHELREKGSQI